MRDAVSSGSDPSETRFGAGCCAAAPIVFGVAALALGQDANWDLRNYHWYNPYAWLTDRFTIDVAPATYYNPLLDVPLYVLAQHVPARACSFLLGAMHGLNFVPLYLLAFSLCPTWARWRAGAGGALIAAVGVTGGGALGLLGTTFYDNVLSIFVVSAACSAVRALDGTVKRPLMAFAGAGLLVGLATGLKLPVAIFAVGFAIACLIAPGSIGTRAPYAACIGP